MAICNWCNQDMLTADDCSENREIEYPDGEKLNAVPYENEWVHVLNKSTHRCHDCNVRLGSYHHPNCDMERCPRCEGQLISCGCLDEEDQ